MNYHKIYGFYFLLVKKNTYYFCKFRLIILFYNIIK